MNENDKPQPPQAPERAAGPDVRAGTAAAFAADAAGLYRVSGSESPLTSNFRPVGTVWKREGKRGHGGPRRPIRAAKALSAREG